MKLVARTKKLEMDDLKVSDNDDTLTIKSKKNRQQILYKYYWTAYIVDAEKDEVVFEIPQVCASEFVAMRKALRYIKRYEKTGSFEGNGPGISGNAN